VSDESMAVGAFGEAARSQRRRQEVAQPGRELARPNWSRAVVPAPRCPLRRSGPVDGGGASHIACRSPKPALSTREEARRCAL
jgi:hypothetical protein